LGKELISFKNKIYGYHHPILYDTQIRKILPFISMNREENNL
jgi:hypothetical protein